ncbi:allophanate hydrolase [Robbsia andropogonis]|uniref:allophanate hydrolase n=1 Tax=Robbsia andropogonis TaxID=28092 RepID=UPI0009E47E4C|nr:allophanate hydrolase [Robbsia andropogonis]
MTKHPDSHASSAPTSPSDNLFTVTGLLGAYGAGHLTPTQMLQECLARIDAFDRPEVWIARCSPEVLVERCTALDALQQQHGADVLDHFPLFGIPFAVKDNIDVAGLPTTAGCPSFSFLPAHSAFAVQRLLDAGAIVIGKTNLDQFATGLVGTRSPYGAVRHTTQPDRVSGGSSSGSAVAVASHCVAFSLGTDTAGSGRVPAGFNGVVGLKPSLGMISKQGVVPACRTLDTISIFTHHVEDAWRVLMQLAKFDPVDAYSRKVVPLGLLPSSPRIGVPDALEFYGDVLAEQAFSASCSVINERLSLTPEVIPFAPLSDVSALLYDGPWVAERRAAIGLFFDKFTGEIDPVVTKVIGKADYFSAVDAFNAQYALADLRRFAESLFERIDVLMVPTTPTHPLIADVQDKPVELNSQLGIYTNFVNLLDLCALAIPCQPRGDALPAGVTLIAPSGADRRLAVLGAAIQRLFAAVPPAYTPQNVPLPFQEPTVLLAVVGAHLQGQPLNWQLCQAGARFIKATRTAPVYRLYALRESMPIKPGLIRVDAAAGQAVEVEVWEVPLRLFGKFVMDIPTPLGIGTVHLAEAVETSTGLVTQSVKGFICEPAAITADAPDITHFGGWRPYLQSLSSTSSE